MATLSAPSCYGQNGGAQNYILNLAIELVKKGNEVMIIGGKEIRNGVELPDFELIEKVKIFRKGNRHFPLFGVLLSIRKFLGSADHVLENIMTYPFYLPLFFPWSNKFKALKHHFLGNESSNVLPPIKHLLNSLNENVLIPLVYNAKNIAVPSAKTADFLKNKSEKFSAVEIIPPGYIHSKSVLERNRDPTILYLGTLNTNRKKIDDLINAFKLISDSYPKARLLIAGDGPDRPRLEDISKGFPIEFRGYVSEEEKNGLYAQSWIFASPSQMEGFGITWVEANSYGLPVVTYDIGLDTVNEDSAILVPPGNLLLLSKAIERLINDDKLRAKLSQGAIKNANRFSWEHSSDKFMTWVMKD